MNTQVDVFHPVPKHLRYDEFVHQIEAHMKPCQQDRAMQDRHALRATLEQLSIAEVALRDLRCHGDRECKHSIECHQGDVASYEQSPLSADRQR